MSASLINDTQPSWPQSKWTTHACFSMIWKCLVKDALLEGPGWHNDVKLWGWHVVYPWSVRAVVPNLWVKTPLRGHKINMKGHEMIYMIWKEEEKHFCYSNKHLHSKQLIIVWKCHFSSTKVLASLLGEFAAEFPGATAWRTLKWSSLRTKHHSSWILHSRTHRNIHIYKYIYGGLWVGMTWL